MYKVMKAFICKGCVIPVTGTGRTCVVIGVNANLEVVDGGWGGVFYWRVRFWWRSLKGKRQFWRVSLFSVGCKVGSYNRKYKYKTGSSL